MNEDIRKLVDLGDGWIECPDCNHDDTRCPICDGTSILKRSELDERRLTEEKRISEAASGPSRAMPQDDPQGGVIR